MFQEKNEVLWNKKIGPSYYRIGIKCHREYSDAQPGQFIMLGFGDQIAPLLRRPFSIHRLVTTDNHGQGIEVLYKVVGTCTKRLSTYEKGDFIDILGPLGNHFLIPDKIGRIFMVAGGVGIAPMVFLASFLQKKGVDLSKCMVFNGGRSKDDLLCEDHFFNLGISVNTTTDDGSAGKKGFVTNIVSPAIKEHRPDMIYACGPTPMLKAVAQMAEMHAVPCQVSIETMMACGMGACLGCAVESKKDSDKYFHACADGPVFDASIIKLY